MKSYMEIYKQAGVYTDVAGSIVSPALTAFTPVIGPNMGYLNTAGGIVGALQSKMT